MASLNFGCETAKTMGLRQEEVFAEKEGSAGLQAGNVRMQGEEGWKKETCV